MVNLQQSPAAPLWRNFLNLEASATEMAAARRVVDFWRPEKAHAMAALLGRFPTWERHFLVRDEGERVRAVDSEEYSTVPVPRRFCQHDRAGHLQRHLGADSLLSAEDRRILRQFFAFCVLTPALALWVSEQLGVGPLQATSVEVSRYGPRDFIVEHTDAVGPRIANLVTYFDPEYQPKEGGTLSIKDSEGNVVSFPPRFNSAVLLTLADRHAHWVEPWSSARMGRLTMSISFSPQTGVA